jgi:hypothetical protein
MIGMTGPQEQLVSRVPLEFLETLSQLLVFKEQLVSRVPLDLKELLEYLLLEVLVQEDLLGLQGQLVLLDQRDL